MRYRVAFEVEVSSAASESEVKDWVRYSINDTGDLKANNPLVWLDLKPVLGSVEIRAAGPGYQVDS
jgi:hypothetical protein